MNIKIKDRWTDKVIFSGEYETIHLAIIDALKKAVSLRGANLRGANLCGADLRGANLRGANLCGADLCGADLRGANLCGANLRGADLRGANLCGANLRDADLRGADLCGANLCDAKDAELTIARTRILPAGTLTGFKKAYDLKNGSSVIIELEIPKDARRSHAFGRKCRADKAIVVSISNDCVKACSSHDSSFTYEVGQTVTPKETFSEEWTEECASGIHFWITKEEAEAY